MYVSPGQYGWGALSVAIELVRGQLKVSIGREEERESVTTNIAGTLSDGEWHMANVLVTSQVSF